MAEATPFWIAMQSWIYPAAENGGGAAIAGPGGFRSVSPFSRRPGRGSSVGGHYEAFANPSVLGH